MRHRSLPTRAVLVALLVVLAACSTGGSDGGGNEGRLQLGDDQADESTTSTTTYVDAAKERNLQAYLTALRTRSTAASAAPMGSPAARYTAFLRALPPGSATVEGSGTEYRLCGPGQPAGCSTLSGFEYDGSGLLTDLSVEGVPVSDRLRGEGLNPNPTTGDIASLALQWAYLRPDGVLHVVEQYWWSTEVRPDTNGCDPREATYSQGGAVADAQGGGPGSEPLGPWVMSMQFPGATLGGEVKIPCYRADGSSEVFTQLIPA